MQVDGYSLDAQYNKLCDYAKYQDMIVVKTYSDEGKSGKNLEGRPSFRQMLRDIEDGVDDVDFVLVMKLSRFGRNASDVLNSLQLMQDCDVNLISVVKKIIIIFINEIANCRCQKTKKNYFGYLNMKLAKKNKEKF